MESRFYRVLVSSALVTLAGSTACGGLAKSRECTKVIETMNAAIKRTHEYVHHQDASGGWVEVPRQLLIDLGINGVISSASRQLGRTVYLEDDTDAEILRSVLTEAWTRL